MKCKRCGLELFTVFTRGLVQDFCHCDGDEQTPVRFTLAKEDHACFTGECGHDKQGECDAQLATDYPEGTR